MLLCYQVDGLCTVHKISCLHPIADSLGLLDSDPNSEENMSGYYFCHFQGLTMTDWS